MLPSKIVTTLLAIVLAFPAAQSRAQDVVKVGIVLPMTGSFAAAGRQVLAGISLFMRQNDDSVAGKKIQLIGRHFEAKLESGEADLALGAFPGAPRGLRRQRLYFSSYLSVARRNHPKLARLRTSAGFRAAHHIIVMASDLGHAAHHMAQHALEAEIAPQRVLLRLSSFIAATIVASRTDGVATVPENVAMHLAEQLGLATFRPSIPLPQFEIAQYWHERCHRDPGHRWLRAASFDLFAKSRAQRL